MANHKSAIKRIRQNERRRNVNRRNLGRLRSEIKKLVKALNSGESDGVQKIYGSTSSAIDKSVQKGVIKKAKANRLKSRLSRRIKAAQTAA